MVLTRRSACAGLIAGLAFGARRALAQGRSDPWLAHGFLAEERAAIEAALKASVERKLLAGGLLLIAHRGERVLERAFGHADLARRTPFAPAAPIHLASMTKAVTATLIARLVDAGELDFEAPISDYLPAFEGLRLRDGRKPARVPLLRELLAHTSGFPGSQSAETAALHAEPLPADLAAYAERVASFGLLHEPGTHFDYTSLGFGLAGRIAEVVRKQPIEAIFEAEVFAPLGMARATFHPSAEDRAAMPTLYVRTEEGFAPVERHPYGAAGEMLELGGGLYATLEDVASFWSMHASRGLHQGTRYLGEDTILAMRRAQPGTKDVRRAPYWGLGLLLYKVGEDGLARRIYHGGSSGTRAYVDEEDGTLVILLTQTLSSSGVRDDEAFGVLDTVFAIAQRRRERG